MASNHSRKIAESISKNLGFGGKTEPWDINEAGPELGDELARFAPCFQQPSARGQRPTIMWAAYGVEDD
jgi:hypothetical protein